MTAKGPKKTRTRSFGASERVGHDSSAFYDRKMYVPNTTGESSADAGTVSRIDECLVNRVFHKSSENMSELPDNSVHLMVTSPPYNVGKDYEDDLSLQDYRSLLKRVMAETYRVLVPGGRACINIANVGRKPYIPLNYMIGIDTVGIGFHMRGEVIWNKSASAGASCAWGSWRSAANPVLRDVHEYIMIFCKEDFSRGDSTGGEATIGRDEFLEFTKSIWTMPTESAKKARHPAPFPVELPRRLIQLYTFKGEVVLDPFMGSGTTAVAAVMSNRKWVGYEISKDYIGIVHQRVREETHEPLFE